MSALAWIAPSVVFVGSRLWRAISTVHLRAEILREEFREEAPPASEYHLLRLSPGVFAGENPVCAGQGIVRPAE
jgi:hypothetical protein